MCFSIRQLLEEALDLPLEASHLAPSVALASPFLASETLQCRLRGVPVRAPALRNLHPREPAVLPSGSPTRLETLRRAWAGAQAAVQPAAPFAADRARLAGPPRVAPWCWSER